jgi:glycine oxidase
VTRRLDADVVVIGGGIVGLACADELSARGKRVVVLERERAGAGAGKVAAGMLAPVSESEAEEPAFVELALASCDMYEAWIQGIEAGSGLRCGYRREGSLLLALHRDHQEELERLAAMQRRLGLASQSFTRDEVIEKEPYVSPRVVGGLFAPNDRQVDPRRLARALAASLTARGATILEGHTARPLLDGARAAGAATDEAEVRAERVLLAGGVWSGAVWPEEAGLLPLRPVKGQLLRLRGPSPEGLIRHVVRTPDVYLVPREDGELLIGATSEEQGYDTSVTVWAVMDLLREAWRVLPGIAELMISEMQAGLRPTLRDHLPAIGATRVQGLFVATGHYRHGVMLAPITARLLADAMDGTGSEMQRAFDPQRFAVEARSG